MSSRSETEAPRIYPTMRCRDAEAMITWLKDVVGFTERVVYRNGGTVHHAELAYGPSLLMLGQTATTNTASLSVISAAAAPMRSTSLSTTPTRCMPGLKPPAQR